MKTSFRLLLLIGTMSIGMGLEQPDGKVRGSISPNDENRELFIFGGLSECQRKLANCQDQTQGNNAPIAGMKTVLERMFSDDKDEITNDLGNALASAETVNFAGFGEEVLTTDGIDIGELVSLGLSVSRASVTEDDAYQITIKTIEVALNTITEIFGVIIGVDLTPVTEFNSLIRKTLAAYPTMTQGQAALEESVKYVFNMIAFILQLSISSDRHSSETAELSSCTEEALSCQFDLYLMNLVPDLLKDLFLAKSFNENSNP